MLKFAICIRCNIAVKLNEKSEEDVGCDVHWRYYAKKKETQTDEEQRGRKKNEASRDSIAVFTSESALMHTQFARYML